MAVSTRFESVKCVHGFFCVYWQLALETEKNSRVSELKHTAVTIASF